MHEHSNRTFLLKKRQYAVMTVTIAVVVDNVVVVVGTWDRNGLAPNM